MAKFKKKPIIVPFKTLPTADLVIDRQYAGGMQKTFAADPFQRLLGVGNQGGFRKKSCLNPRTGLAYVVLFTTGIEPDWPDGLDERTGIFTYYGDNRTPGSDIHDTAQGGNKFLDSQFAALHGGMRSSAIPALIFEKTGKGRDIRFFGLAAPGGTGLTENEDLVAVWRSDRGQRFQNYRARYSILNCRVVSRRWLNDLQDGNPLSDQCPESWRKFVRRGKYDIIASRPIRVRNKTEQLPASIAEKNVVKAIKTHFRGKEKAFERLAADLYQWSDSNVVEIELSPSKGADGGRDAFGKYRLGKHLDSVEVDFVLEAKCHKLDSGAGVKVTSRLISRMRHKMFGIFVTLSYVNERAYREIREDGHPVVVLAARDIAQIIMRKKGLSRLDRLQPWLKENYPV